jgi:hypothetical protein
VKSSPEILTRTFRASPAYELVLFDRLPDEQRRALADLAKDPDFYGVLRPREGSSGLTLKSADRDTALLFLTLREPGSLPAYAAAQLGEAAARVLGRFVADGVLEVERDELEGAFVSGPAAFDLFARAATDGSAREGRISALSLAALRAVQALPVDDVQILSLRLYAFNRLPLTPRWKSLLPDAEAVERHLGIAPGGPHRRTLDRAWQRLPEREGWIGWISRAVGGNEGRSDGPTWKLYVSPRPEALEEGFGAILEALTSARARQFKIGRDAAGLLRADKIVSYFPSFERLAEAADAVVERLAGAPAQGVPFTSEIGGDGLLSWGMDPPRSERSWSLGESWRAWLAQRLARDLLAARQASVEGVEPWRFALDRLRLEGIDTDTWTPGALLWK